MKFAKDFLFGAATASLTFPLTMAGSLMVLINNVLLDPNGFIAKLIHLGDLIPNLSDYQAIFAPVLNGSLNILALFIVFLIARNLAKSLGADDLLTGLTALSVFLIIYPSGENGMLPTQYMGPQGLFVAIIVGILVGEFLSRLSNSPKLEIKMPEQVPPAVARTFKILLPIIIVTVSFSVANFLLLKVVEGGIHELVYNVLQKPLIKLGDSIFSVVTLTLVSNLLWIMGIHGPNTIAAVRDTMFAEANAANLAFAQANGTAWGAPFPTTWALVDGFSNYGGSGCTLGLLIAIFLFSKARDQRDIAKLSIAPGLFNINESVVFGLPIVLNPIFLIPFVLVPVINILIGYFAIVVLKIIPPIAYGVVWTTPGPLIPFLGTGGEIMGLVMGFVCLAVSTLVYAPFVIASNRAAAKQAEAENSNVSV